MRLEILIKNVLCFLLIGLFAAKSKGQIEFADAMFQNGQYKLALLEYNRSSFILDLDPDANVHYRMAECYRNLGNYQLAGLFYDRAYNAFDNDSLKFECLIAKVRLHLLLGQYQRVLIEIIGNQLEHDTNFGKSLMYYKGSAYLLSGDGNNAYDAFKFLVSDTIALQSLLLNGKLKKPRVATMVILSALVPGLGQTIMGDWQSGVNSLVINAVLLGMYMNVAGNLGVLDAVLSTFPWFQRYYQGGLEAVAVRAAEKQGENRVKTLNKVSLLINTT